MKQDEKKAREPVNMYSEMAKQLRLMADQASSSDVQSEYRRLAAAYERLATSAVKTASGVPDAPPLEPYKGVVRLPLQETYFRFTAENVVARAPRAAGIYALWNKEYWLYVGQSENVQDRLLRHLERDNQCLIQGKPTSFGFELIDDPAARATRHSDLIRDLMPIC